MALSNRDALLKLFRGESVDRILWVSDLTYWRDSQQTMGTLPSEYEGPDGFLRLHRDLGVVPYYIYAIEERSDTFSKDTAEVSVHQIGGAGRPYNGVFGLRYEGVSIENAVEGDILETSYHLGGEVLTQRKAYMPDSYCYGFLEYPVRTPHDLQLLREIVERYDFHSTIDDYLYLSELWGEEGVPIAPLPRSPLSALIVDWMGLTAFTFAEADFPDEVRKTLDCIDRSNDRAFELILESPAELFHFCDNLSASNYASFFSRYASGYYRKRFEQLHRRGKRAAVHVDGTMRGILGQLAQVGADAVEALTPKPVGDLAIEEIRSEVGNDRIILWGGFPGALFTPQFHREDLLEQVHSFISCFLDMGPCIAGSADQIPPDADIGSVRYVAELLAEVESEGKSYC